MSKHTPGPWEYYWRVDDENHADCGVYALRRPGQAYAVARCPKYQAKIQWDADARLIAAAPEMLAAIQCLLKDLGTGFDGMPSVGMCRAAVAKATGGES